MKPDWQRLFPDADYRLSMGLRPGEAAHFWADHDAHGGIHAERQRWLRDDLAAYAAACVHAVEAVDEARAWMLRFSTAPEPDWVLMSAETDAEPRVIAGEVVFPSSWALPEKLGLPMSQVHAPVPGLEDQMGAGIRAFLSRLKPQAAWVRENWGLSADAELNHHPKLHRARLPAEARPQQTWIRLEHQFLIRLPATQTILFGIRVTCHRLDEVASMPGMAARIRRALLTMPETIARYKGLHHAVPALAAFLKLPSLTPA